MASASDFTVQAILAQLQTAGSAYAEQKPGAREQLLSLSSVLTAALELPSEAIQRIGWAEPARSAHLRIAVDLKVFELLKTAGTSGVSTEDLAGKTGADEVLVSRIMKHLAATNVVREVGPDTYAPTSFSDALTEQRYRDGIIYTYDVAGPSFRNLPSYLKSTGYVQPTSLVDGPFQAAHKTDLPFFAWLDANPPYMQIFNSYMSAYRAGKISWLDPGFYPVQERLLEQFNPQHSDVLLVDVGGGLGHDLRALREKHPGLPGRLVLQDRAEVIHQPPTTTEAAGDDDNGIGSGNGTAAAFEAMAHDFFTPQPVRGARAYYLHSVLHDWGDDDCVKILEALRPAMRAGYSTVLINELVVPGQKAEWPVTSMDHLMLALGAMRERTEAEWRGILKRAGLEVLKIHSVEMGSESLIEAELA